MDLVGTVFTALLTNYTRGKWAETTAEGHLMETSMFLSQPVQKNDTWKTSDLKTNTAFAAFTSRCIVLVQMTGTHNVQRGLNQQMTFVCKVNKVTDTSALQIVLLMPGTRWSPNVPQQIILMFAGTISTLPGLGTPDLISSSAALFLSQLHSSLEWWWC